MGLLDFITVPIVSTLTGISQQNVKFATQFVPPTFGPSTLVEPLIRLAAPFVPEAQAIVNAAADFDAALPDWIDPIETDVSDSYY